MLDKQTASKVDPENEKQGSLLNQGMKLIASLKVVLMKAIFFVDYKSHFLK